MQKIKENKINAWGITILDVKIYYRSIVIKTMEYWQKKQTHRTIEPYQRFKCYSTLYENTKKIKDS